MIQRRAPKPGGDRIIWQTIALTYDVDGRPIMGELDLAALCRNQELKNVVVEMIDMQHDWNTMPEGVRTRISDMHRRLEENGDGKLTGGTP